MLNELYEFVSNQKIIKTEEVNILNFNLLQLKNFFDNLVRIKNLEKCKPSLKKFIKNIQIKNELDNPNRTKIDINSHYDNNLVDNLFKSVKPVHFKYMLPNYLSTKKKVFNSKNPNIENLNCASGAFQKIKLSTVKNKNCQNKLKGFDNSFSKVEII